MATAKMGLAPVDEGKKKKGEKALFLLSKTLAG
jgi:hypothetical protein